MDFVKIKSLILILFSGIDTTLEIFFIVLILSIPLGIIIATFTNSKNILLKNASKIYIYLIRGTPIMLQIIFVYFAPYYIFKLRYDRFLAVIVAFSLNYAAYFSEIFRSGLNSVPKGQIEASIALGFNRIQTFLYIILPQVIKIVLPAMSNEVVSLIKTTSLAQLIGVTEMFSLAQKQSSYSFSVIPLVIASCYYLILVAMISKVFSKIEKKLDYYN